jgi:hypothetical protein
LGIWGNGIKPDQKIFSSLTNLSQEREVYSSRLKDIESKKVNSSFKAKQKEDQETSFKNVNCSNFDLSSKLG